MRLMKKLIVLLLLPVVALAQQLFPAALTLSWTNASQYEDGSTIEAGDLASVRVECTRNNDTVPTFTATVPATGEGLPQSEVFDSAIPNPGTYTCVAFSILFDGTESVASNSTEKKYTGRPKPPSNLGAN